MCVFLHHTDVETITSQADKARLSVEIGITSPSVISDIKSPTHVIEIKRTSSLATVRLPQPFTWDKEFILLIDIPKVHEPRLWLEQYNGHTAAMLTMYPHFEQDSLNQTVPQVKCSSQTHTHQHPT